MEHLGTCPKVLKRPNAAFRRKKKVHNQLEFSSRSEDEAASVTKLVKITFGRKTNVKDLWDVSSDEFNYSCNVDFSTYCKFAQDRSKSLQTKGKTTVE